MTPFCTGHKRAIYYFSDHIWNMWQQNLQIGWLCSSPPQPLLRLVHMRAMANAWPYKRKHGPTIGGVLTKRELWSVIHVLPAGHQGLPQSIAGWEGKILWVMVCYRNSVLIEHFFKTYFFNLFLIYSSWKTYLSGTHIFHESRQGRKSVSFVFARQMKASFTHTILSIQICTFSDEFLHRYVLVLTKTDYTSLTSIWWHEHRL